MLSTQEVFQSVAEKQRLKITRMKMGRNIKQQITESLIYLHEQHEQLKSARKPHAFKIVQLLNVRNKNIM